MTAGSAPALPRGCPRCTQRLVRNHDELVCLVHGQVYEPIRAWETAPAEQPLELAAGRMRRRAPKVLPVPWTEEERELWRRAEAGEEVCELPAPKPETEEAPMDTEPKGMTLADIAAATKARGETLRTEIAELEAALVARREEASKLVAVFAALEMSPPAALVQLSVKRKAAAAREPVPEGERWTCPDCGWQGKGRYPGMHPKFCSVRKEAQG